MTSQLPVFPVRGRRLSGVIADRIVHDIFTSDLAPGVVFGLERDLIARYQVSRATLREAVRQVEQHRTAHMRRGGGGGLVVADTAHGALARTIARYLEFSDITLAEQFDLRVVLETLAARLAAEHSDDAAIAVLRGRLQQLIDVKDLSQVGHLNRELRLAIATNSGNTTLSLFIAALHRVATDLSLLLTGSPEDADAYLRTQLTHMRTLVDAIASGDAGAAQQTMRAERAYLHERPALAPYLGVAISDLLIQAGERHLIAADHGQADEKLGILTALRVRHEIAALGWPVGRNLGPEHDLCAHYGVSKSVMREAIMLLELHGILTVRRGKLGGVEVGRPDMAYTVEAATYFLRYVRPATSHLALIGAELAAEAAQTLAVVATEADLAELRSVAQPNESGAAGWPEFAAVQRKILSCAGNRAMVLIGEIVLACLGRDDAILLSLGKRETANMLTRRLLDAIGAGDEPVAARRMRALWGGAL